MGGGGGGGGQFWDAIPTPCLYVSHLAVHARNGDVQYRLFSFRRITRQGTPQLLRCVHVHTCCVHLYLAAVCMYITAAVYTLTYIIHSCHVHVCSCCHGGGMLHNSCSS